MTRNQNFDKITIEGQLRVIVRNGINRHLTVFTPNGFQKFLYRLTSDVRVVDKVDNLENFFGTHCIPLISPRSKLTLGAIALGWASLLNTSPSRAPRMVPCSPVT